ncbi:TetR family transcriptional regulator [Rhodoplanes sp. TEM]|uniref:TetR family transcriptional regulator n=1 Tax=Rhodoplanes tepidamans TaxID=200616 RepID=A0ABT5JFN0_RHOTP|nr:MULTISPECIES: TetR family transcriptional regulator [Rhodoplanes]MDC7788377.1 TetR family transcriptional regulator [Rhodoplanes tepidamans]MDC7985342.1 TetR family transcriptional regulator [Rhodoplanes sp. TEM]MDQ0357124.1 AcrR family transcriptional regulator [Rhodoplanes tepidamans]
MEATLTKSDPPKRPTGPRDPVRTRAAILDAATHEFRAKGLNGARVDTIAKRSGVNKRMIYHYFGGKEGLYVAVLEATYSAIRHAEGDLHLGDREPLEAICELVRFTWRYFIKHPEFLSLLGTENLHRARYLKQSARIRDLHSPLIATLSHQLDRGAAKGVIRPGIDPVQLYISIASLGFFYLSNRYTLATIFGRSMDDAESLEARGRHIEDVVLAYLRP